MTGLRINGTAVTLPEGVDPNMPLLWVLREHLGLTGSKFGCGQGLCGACTVHVDGQPVRSCLLPVGQLADRSITTIEGLGGNHPVQQAWREIGVPQCGYRQSGQIMSAVALLENKPQPDDEDINRAMSGNICRCGTYPRIRRAIHRAAALADVQYHDPAGEG